LPTDDAALLNAYRPVMQYDSHEPYFADHTAAIADRPGNRLLSAKGGMLATADSGRGLLSLLGPEAYAGLVAKPANTDCLKEVGSDPQLQAAVMHGEPDIANKVHGIVARDGHGTRWLQYWFFMYYDDPGMLGFGTHEGDLEMIQLALGSDDSPVTAVYAHHRSGFRVAFDEVETDQVDGVDGVDGVEVPVVFSARGSHASMLRSGSQTEGSPVPDHNDAKGPRVRPDVVALSEAATPWVWWPGSWGGTKAGSSILGHLGVDANSPYAFTRHPAWSAPLQFAQACAAPSLPPIGQPLAGAPSPPPPTPQVSVVSRDGQLAVDVDASDAAVAGATQVVVSARPAGSSDPAVSRSLTLAHHTVGTVTLPMTAAGPHDVHVVAVAPDGSSSDTASTR
jgi:hypothetical protein